MILKLFLLFSIIILIHFVLFKLKIYLKLTYLLSLFYFPFVTFIFLNDLNLINVIYLFVVFNILFLAYYFALLGIINDSPSLIIIREILKKNLDKKKIKKKFIYEKLIEKRISELKSQKYIYIENKLLKIRRNKIYIIKFFLYLRKLQDQFNKKNG